MLTSNHIERVQSSFGHCLPIADEVAGTFYTTLFRLAPETRRMFTDDMRDQGRKLVMTLAAVVDALDHLDAILPTVRDLAIRHVRYGVVDRHYAVAGRALIETLRLQLGAMFDDETEAAWRAAYALLADTMIAAAGRR